MASPPRTQAGLTSFFNNFDLSLMCMPNALVSIDDTQNSIGQKQESFEFCFFICSSHYNTEKELCSICTNLKHIVLIPQKRKSHLKGEKQPTIYL